MARTVGRRKNGGTPFAQLTEFCHWWDTQERKSCCQFADDELLESDGQQFDCTTCTAPERLEELDPANREAWQVFGQVVSRLCVDVPGLVSPILARVVSDKSGDDATDLLQRMTLIYDAVSPPKTS